MGYSWYFGMWIIVSNFAVLFPDADDDDGASIADQVKTCSNLRFNCLNNCGLFSIMDIGFCIKENM